MPKRGTKRASAIRKLKKSGATQDKVRSFLRGWDQLDYLVEKNNDKAKRKRAERDTNDR
jgi:hypothetical protein